MISHIEYLNFVFIKLTLYVGLSVDIVILLLLVVYKNISDVLTCQPASMVLRSFPKEPEMTQICDKLNSFGSVT